MTRKKVFSIDGGAGRAICAIPALEKYARLHPDEDWNIIIGGWDTLYFGNPLLQERTYSMDVKGIFNNLIKDNQIIHPEPYTKWEYYNQQCSLAEAFDKEINETDDHSDLGKPNLYLCKAEEKNAANMLASVKAKQGKDITIVIQPFGRSARVDNGDIIDDSTRSIEPHVFVNLVSQDDQISEKPQGVDLRFWSAIMESVDYFIGCDSVGQHMARAFNIPGTVIMGSTYASNVSYPDYFNVIENKNVEKVYSPIRVAGFDCHLTDRLNDKLMDFSEEEVDEIYKSIVKDIKDKM